MITKDNIQAVVEQLSEKDKRRLKNSDKEYVVLELHCFNAGSRTDMKLTNDYNRYKNISNHGNCILPIEDEVFSDITGWRK